MKTIYQDIRNDEPASPGEIEIAPALHAIAPRRVAACEAPTCVLEYEALRLATEREIAEKQEALERARVEALSVQQKLEEKTTAVEALRANIPHAESDLANIKDRIAWLEGYVEKHWREPLQDHIEEFQRQSFLAERLPRYISTMKSTLKSAEQDLATFRKEHGFAIK